MRKFHTLFDGRNQALTQFFRLGEQETLDKSTGCGLFHRNELATSYGCAGPFVWPRRIL